MFLFARVFGLFFLFFLIVAPCSERCVYNEIKCCVIVGTCPALSIICQNLVILIKLEVPCGVIFII